MEQEVKGKEGKILIIILKLSMINILFMVKTEIYDNLNRRNES